MKPIDRLSPLRLSKTITLKNRVVLAPMASETASEDGLVTEDLLVHYDRLSQSGASLMMVEYTYVHSTGRSEAHQLGISSDSHIAGLRHLAKLIHGSGAVASIQLTHAGGKSNRSLSGGKLMGPSAVSVPVKDRELETPDMMSLDEIRLWRTSFVLAAGRAERAGFEIVELHSAHGYGLNQWLSPITNKRTDFYGGSLKNRSRLLLEIIHEIKLLHPSLIISVRMPGRDFYPGGLTSDDTIQLAKWLEQDGVDILNISSGIGGWRRPSSRSGEGYLTEEAGRIKKNVSVPVIGVGGIESPEYIDYALSRGIFDLAAVGRAILSDPSKFYVNCLSSNSVRLGKPRDAFRFSLA